MGERRSDGGVPGRRRVHPGGTASGPAGAGPDGPVTGRAADGAALEAQLAARLRAGHVDAEAERRAVAAFRAARDAGAHRARTRRRDDWRPRERRGTRRTVKATISMLLAGLTLGGVAVAAIGVAGSSSDGAGADAKRPRPSSSGPGQPDGGPSAASPGVTASRPGRPAPAQDTEAQCRAYEQVKGRGKAMEATAWQRLVAAAGGEDDVAAYCAQQLATATAEANPGNADRPDKGSGGTAGAGSGSGNGSNGNTGSGQAGSGAGSGTDADTGQSNGKNQ